MKSLSEKFVLIFLLLQPCAAVPELVNVNQLEFGDIITFPKCYGAYDHYAVFVGDVMIVDRPVGTNIFEKTRKPPGCRFSTVAGEVNRNNYVDDETHPRQTNEEIIANIVRLIGNETECGSWKLTNNCEHIATYVRNGEASAQCNQPGTGVAEYCKFFIPVRRRVRSGNLHQGENAAAA